MSHQDVLRCWQQVHAPLGLRMAVHVADWLAPGHGYTQARRPHWQRVTQTVAQWSHGPSDKPRRWLLLHAKGEHPR